MDYELFLKIFLIVEYILFSVIRIRYQQIAYKASYKTVIVESKKYAAWLSVFICYEVLTLFIFLLSRHVGLEILSFANIALPLSVRLVGVVFGVLALALFIWTHQNLRYYFTMMLRIMEGHQLVETGPYRWVRHPMYTAFYLLHISAFLLTANWFIGITWILGLTLIMFFRVGREEEMMLQSFGDRYHAYMERTSRFLPRSLLTLVNRKRIAKSMSIDHIIP